VATSLFNVAASRLNISSIQRTFFKNTKMNKTIFSYILILSYALSHTSCHSRIVPQHSETTDTHGKPELLGVWTKERLQQAPYDSWFVKNYKDYVVDSATADLLKPALAGKKLKIFMGTWCGDSQREVPRIFKILDYCGIKASSVQLILVSNADSTIKQSPGHEEKGLDIFRVPDLIVYDQGNESGRIVESPVNSLEKDLLVITGGQAYTPNYKGAAFMIHLFRTEKIDQIQGELPAIAGQVRPLVTSAGELKSYAHVMQMGGEKDKAEIALKVNALIFVP
jgi:hypothetical protein